MIRDRRRQEQPKKLDTIDRYLDSLPVIDIERRVVRIMLSRSADEISIKQLCEYLDCSNRQAGRYFQHLRECGVVARKAGTDDEYRLSDPRIINHKQTLITH